MLLTNSASKEILISFPLLITLSGFSLLQQFYSFISSFCNRAFLTKVAIFLLNNTRSFSNYIIGNAFLAAMLVLPPHQHPSSAPSF